ncbi:Choline-sulfatase [Planctomycetales bacterium 10988]|nr:Choline-sulfatase [Planctomycetales bacterium 10988]
MCCWTRTWWGLLLGWGLSLPFVTFTNAEETSPPNIVMIISDDQYAGDFGFMGNDKVQTPHLDRLAEQSVRFVNGYVPSSVCRPSLVTLLTGQYPHQNGVHFNHPPPGFGKLRSPGRTKAEFDALREQAIFLIKQAPSLPRILQEQGYRSLQTGKYWEGHYRNAGFTAGMTTAQPSGGPYGDLTLPSGEVVAHGNGDAGLMIGRETMQPIDDFLEDAGDSPFLLWYAPFLPHTPHNAPEEFTNLYREQPSIPEHTIPYYASISQFDATVGDLIAKIESRGLIQKTLFVFVIDNGWQADPERFREQLQEWDHTKESKRAPFEPGLRTPILFRWEGKFSPTTHSELVSSVDIVPTLVAAAGLNPKQYPFGGENLLPVLEGQAKPQKNRAVFGAIYPGDATSLNNPAGDVAYRWVRQGKYKLIIPHSQQGQKPWNRYLLTPALYNVEADPQESNNLYKQEKFQKVVQKLNKKLNNWWNPKE